MNKMDSFLSLGVIFGTEPNGILKVNKSNYILHDDFGF